MKYNLSVVLISFMLFWGRGYSLSLESVGCDERDYVSPTFSNPENIAYDFQALTVNRPEKTSEGTWIRSRVVYVLRDSLKKFNVDDEFVVPWPEKFSEKPFHTLTFFFGQYDSKGNFKNEIYRNIRQFYYTPSVPEDFMRPGLGDVEDFWQYYKFCNNRHDIRTRRPDGRSYHETAVEFMRGTPYEKWMDSGDSIAIWSSLTFQEYMKNIKKNPKQIDAFENALKNRIALKVDSVSKGFVALGTIWKSVQHRDYCEIHLAPQYTFKSKGANACGERQDMTWITSFETSDEMKSIIARKKGPCFELSQDFKADYFVGHYEESQLVLDSVFSSWDYVYHKGLMIDISFGLPYEKFLSHLIPDHLTLDDIFTSLSIEAFKDVYKDMSKETAKKAEQVTKKIQKVCKEFTSP